MKVLYIGQYTEGTTSRMRAESLKKLLQPDSFEIIDTHVPFFKTNVLVRSFGFRYKCGPLISAVNKFIVKQLSTSRFDLVWVDKAIFMTPKTTKLLKSRTSQLIHFTPDMAFYSNASRYFNKSIINYDYVVTTKSKEVEIYEGIVNKDKIIVVTQGFDKQIHKPYHTFEEKDNAIVFIGLAEPSRLEIAEQIINNNIRLKLVGKGWKGFVEKHRSNQNFNYYGDAVYNEEYGRLISSSKFALGLLSKRFPEFHTTRTLEIPACGTALLTESNIETASLFSKNDVIFYDNYEDIIKKIKYFLNNQDLLQKIMTNGHEKVIKKGYDYESILQSILERIKE